MTKILKVDEFIAESAGARIKDRTPQRFNSDPLANKKPNNVLGMSNSTSEMVAMSEYINSELMKYIDSKIDYGDFFMTNVNEKFRIGLYEADNKTCDHLVLFIPLLYDKTVFAFLPSDSADMNDSQINALKRDKFYVYNDSIRVKVHSLCKRFCELENEFDLTTKGYDFAKSDRFKDFMRDVLPSGIKLYSSVDANDNVNGVVSIGNVVYGEFRETNDGCCLVDFVMKPSLTKDDADNRVALSKTIIDGLYQSVYNYLSRIFL